MPTTYEPVATTTVAIPAASITFSSITSAYTDLRVVFTNTSTVANQNISLTLNGDTATNYSSTAIRGNGTSVLTNRSTSGDRIDMSPDGSTTTPPHFFTMDIFSYAGATNKTILIEATEDNNGSGTVSRRVALYRSTSAITSVTLTCNTSTWSAGTTATLYGILKA